MNITKKVKLIRKLAKEVEGEIEDNTNYFMMHNRKYYLKKGKLYTSTHYIKPIGSITMKGDIEMHKRSKRTKTHKVKNTSSLNASGLNNSGIRSSNNMSRRININKNKNKNKNANKNKNSMGESPEPEESTTVTNLSRNTVMHETEEPEIPPAPVDEEEIPVSEEPKEESVEESVEESSSSNSGSSNMSEEHTNDEPTIEGSEPSEEKPTEEV